MADSVIHDELWTLPGGGLDFGEAPEAAVLRELTEETGHDGTIVSLFDVNDRLIEQGDGLTSVHAIRIVYRVRITGGALRDEVEGSTDTCACFTIETADGLNLSDPARRAMDLLGAANG